MSKFDVKKLVREFELDEEVTRIFEGTEETKWAAGRFIDMLDKYHARHDEPVDDEFWIFYDLSSDSYSAICTKDEDKIDPAEIIFSRGVITLTPEDWVFGGFKSAKVLWAREHFNLNKKAVETGDSKECLVILGNVCDGILRAYSFNRKALCYIEGYKTYCKNFIVTFDGCEAEPDGYEHYCVLNLSSDFRRCTGLSVATENLSIKLAGDPWIKRAPYVPKEGIVNYLKDGGIPEDKVDIYLKSVSASNRARVKDMKKDALYESLERRLMQLDRFVDIEPPICILVKQVDMICEAYKRLELD